MIVWAAIALIVIGMWPVWKAVLDPTVNWAKDDPTVVIFWTAPFVVPTLLLISSKASWALAWLVATVPLLLYASIWFRTLEKVVLLIFSPLICLLILGPAGLVAFLVIRHVRRRKPRDTPAA